MGCVRDDFAACAAGWRQEHDDRERRVAELLHEAKEALAGRDLQTAERCVEQAQGLWRESAEAQAFAHQLGKLRKQAVTLEEVAAMTIFLCSPAARYINGASLIADGAQYLGNWSDMWNPDEGPASS